MAEQETRQERDSNLEYLVKSKTMEEFSKRFWELVKGEEDATSNR